MGEQKFRAVSMSAILASLLMNITVRQHIGRRKQKASYRNFSTSFPLSAISGMEFPVNYPGRTNTGLEEWTRHRQFTGFNGIIPEGIMHVMISVQPEQYDVAVIGAGPAGMMAAVTAAQYGARVVLLEKNPVPGVKLLLTGKERCNITNSEKDIRQFALHFGKNGRFLLSALSRFGVRETLVFFHEHNLPTVVERGGRIFPDSDRAKDVQGLFMRLMKERDVKLRTRCTVKKIVYGKDRVERIFVDDDAITAGTYIISTGGLSYPGTGSTGDGYSWARAMGHSIIDPEPALSPVTVREPWVRDLEGVSLKNVSVSIYQNNRKQDDRFGEALFTGFGMSGPIILDMSKSIGQLLKKGDVAISIDFKPALDFPLLDKRILRDLKKQGSRAMKNILPGLLPRKLVPVMLRLAEIDPEKKGRDVTKEERRRLRLLLKEFPLTATGLAGFGKAIITSGGIALKEVDPDTMRSKIISNLYFAGEVLDLDGPTGGFNLQVCWSTGYLAGASAAGVS